MMQHPLDQLAGSMPPPPEPWGTTDRERAAARWLHANHRGYWGRTDALPDARELLAEVDDPEPDWADVREAARKAGYRLFEIAPRGRRRIWGIFRGDSNAARGTFERLALDQGATAIRIELNGDQYANGFHLQDPTPATVLAIARLVGLDGAS